MAADCCGQLPREFLIRKAAETLFRPVLPSALRTVEGSLPLLATVWPFPSLEAWASQGPVLVSAFP